MPQTEHGPGSAADVIGPATNTADHVPQWNGANSKTLKDGLDVDVASGIALLNASAVMDIAKGGTASTTLVGASIATVIQLTWTGNGNDNRSLTGVGFNPNFVISGIVEAYGAGSAIKFSSQDGADLALNLAVNTPITNLVQDFVTDGIQVGSAEMNVTDKTYEGLFMLTATGAASG